LVIALRVRKVSYIHTHINIHKDANKILVL
jgi:hypothetical protein